MPFDANLRRLEGKKGLVIGIANEQSIAWGCARAFRAFGAELAITYLNDKAKPYVEPLAKRARRADLLPLDVQVEGQLEAVFEAIGGAGAGSTSCCTRSRLRPGPTCTAGWSTAPRRAFCRRWKCPASRSFAWRSWPSR